MCSPFFKLIFISLTAAASWEGVGGHVPVLPRIDFLLRRNLKRKYRGVGDFWQDLFFSASYHCLYRAQLLFTNSGL